MTRKPSGAGQPQALAAAPDAQPEAPGAAGGPDAGGRRAAARRATGRAGGGAGGAGGRVRQTPWRAAFFALAAVAIVAGVAWALLDSRFFVVRSVQVTGTHLVPQAEVRAAAAIPAGLPLARVNGAAVARRVERIRQVLSARVSTGWPDRVTIAVTERTPALAVPSGAGYELIDRYGVAVEQAARRPARLPLLELPAGTPLSALRGSRAVYAAAVVARELPPFLARPLVTVQAPSATEVTLKLRNGVTIVWGSTARPAEKARELAILMRRHARNYDVSAPGTAATSG